MYLNAFYNLLVASLSPKCFSDVISNSDTLRNARSHRKTHNAYLSSFLHSSWGNTGAIRPSFMRSLVHLYACSMYIMHVRIVILMFVLKHMSKTHGSNTFSNRSPRLRGSYLPGLENCLYIVYFNSLFSRFSHFPVASHPLPLRCHGAVFSLQQYLQKLMAKLLLVMQTHQAR